MIEKLGKKGKSTQGRERKQVRVIARKKQMLGRGALATGIRRRLTVASVGFDSAFLHDIPPDGEFRYV